MNKIVLISLLFLSSCAYRYTPIANTNFDKVDFSEVRNFEQGKSCKRFLLGIPLLPLPFGDPSLISAVKDGKLREVKVVDYENGFELFLLPHTKRCIVAYGLR